MSGCAGASQAIGAWLPRGFWNRSDGEGFQDLARTLRKQFTHAMVIFRIRKRLGQPATLQHVLSWDDDATVSPEVIRGMVLPPPGKTASVLVDGDLQVGL